MKDSVDQTKAKEYFEKLEGTAIPDFKINIKIYDLLRDFILRGGFEMVEAVVAEKVWHDQAAEEKGAYQV